MKPRIKSMIRNIRKQKTSISTVRRKKNLKDKNRIRSLWDISKYMNIQIIGVPKEKRKSKKFKTYLKK